MDQQTKDYYRCMSNLKIGDVVIIGLNNKRYPTAQPNPKHLESVSVLKNGTKSYYKDLIMGYNRECPLLLGSRLPIPGFWPRGLTDKSLIGQDIEYCFWASIIDVRILKRKPIIK